MYDLATKPEQKNRIQRLFTELLELQSQTGDTLDLRSIFPTLSQGA